MTKTKYHEIVNNTNFAPELFKDETSSLPRGLVDWESSKDFVIHTKDGNKLIDFTSGIFVTNAGHNNPKICKAIKNQLESLLFSYQYGTEIRDKFKFKLLSISPPHLDKVVLTVTGSEATDTAYKLIKYWAAKNGRRYIITFKGNYHGHMLGSLILTNGAKWSGLFDPNILQLDFPEDHFDFSKLPPLNEIAAVFLETYRGWDAKLYPKLFLDKLFDNANKYGFLVGFDEAQSGFFRMGTLFGYQSYGDYKPDFICLAKGISSSLPISCVLGTTDLINCDNSMDIWGTHSGNSLCCAAALENIKFLTSAKFLKHLTKIIKVFEYELDDLKSYGSVKHINTKGMVAALIFENEAVATRIVKACARNGVLLVHTRRESIKIAPPLTIKRGALVEGFSILKETLKEEEKNS